MMNSVPLLADIHRLTHISLARMLEHAAGFTDEEIAREWDGFGHPSLRLQLHHAIGGEQVWIGVLLRGEVHLDEKESDYATVAALDAFRQRVAAITADLLGTAGFDWFTPRTVRLGGGAEREIVPARVLLRTQTHIYHHLGQAAAISRLLGRPAPLGLDYTVTP